MFSRLQNYGVELDFNEADFSSVIQLFLCEAGSESLDVRNGWPSGTM